MILGILIILIIATALSIYFKRSATECLPMAVFGIIFVLYIFGIINLLILGFIVVLLSSILSLLFIIYRCIKKKINLFKHLSMNTLFFIGMIIFVYLIVKGSKIVCYDEFTAWGLFVKTSLQSSQLYIFSPFQALAKNYQSGTAIFQIFIEVFNFKFSEDLLFVSMHIIYFSMASILFKGLKAKNVLELLSRSLLIIIIPLSLCMWPINYYTILVDVILGFTFAYIIYYYFTNKLEKFTFINIALAIFFLTCSKGNGLVLSIMAITIIYMDLILFRRKAISQDIKSDYKKGFIIILLPLLSILFAFFSWTICLKIIGIKPSQNQVGGLFDNIFSAEFYPRLHAYIAIIYNKFLEYLNYIILISSVAITIFFSRIKKTALAKHGKRYFLISLLYIILSLAYLFFLFIVCNSMATKAIATDALTRYIFTLIAANTILVSFSLVYFAGKGMRLNISIIILAITFVATPANNQVEKFIHGDYTKQYTEYRKQFEPITEKLRKVDINHDVVYYINETEVDIYISNFVVFPMELSPIPYWYDGVPYKNYNDLLLSKQSIELFTAGAKTKYETKKQNDKTVGDIYIYIYKVTDGTYKRYNSLFSNSGLSMVDNSLYLVTKKDDLIRLSLTE